MESGGMSNGILLYYLYFQLFINSFITIGVLVLS